MRKPLLAHTLAAVLLALSVGPPLCHAAGRPFKFINRGDVITLDLNQASYLQDFRILYAIREGLYSYDAKTLKPLLALAESADVTPDKKTWTYKIRAGAKWSNGDPVTAKDFVFSWKQLLESPGEYTYLFYYIKGAREYEAAYREGKGDFATVGITAPDDRTLVVQLGDPVLFMDELMAFPTFFPRNEKSMEPFRTSTNGKTTYKDEYTRPPAVVTNGPFKLTGWDLGRSLTMTRDPNYWDVAHVQSEELDMVVNNDPLSAFQQYDSGQVDWLADVSPKIAFDLKQANRGDLRTSTGFGTNFVTVNCKPSIPGIIDRNPLADVRVRRALDLAVDKNAIVEKVTKMGEAIAQTYVPPGIFEGYNPRGGEKRDVDKAKALLAEAGFPAGKGFPDLSIVYNTDNKTRELIAQQLRSQWKRTLGITVEVRGLELVGGYRPAVKEKKYTLAIVSWFGDYGDPSTFTDKYLSTSQNNDSAWIVPAFDALLDQAAKETDVAKRLDLLMRAEQMINDERPIVPLYHAVNYSLFRDNVKGMTMNPRQITVWKDVRAD